MIYGLAAAFGWGLSDLWAAISGRRIGSLRTVVIAQVAAGIAVTVTLVVVRPDLSDIPTVAPWLVANAFIGAAAFATLYRALELGPVAIVSPVLATYAVIPVLLSVVLLGETLGGGKIAGVAVTIVGAAVASTDVRALRAGGTGRPAGLPWAIVSMLLFGVATYIMGWAARIAGVVASLWFGRVLLTGVVVIAWMVLRRRATEPNAAREASGGRGLASVVGIAELLGTFAYARGAEVGFVSIVTAASAVYPVVPVVGGVAVLHERPAPTQYAGIAMVIAGLLLLAFA